MITTQQVSSRRDIVKQCTDVNICSLSIFFVNTTDKKYVRCEGKVAWESEALWTVGLLFNCTEVHETDCLEGQWTDEFDIVSMRPNHKLKVYGPNPLSLTTPQETCHSNNKLKALQLHVHEDSRLQTSHC